MEAPLFTPVEPHKIECATQHERLTKFISETTGVQKKGNIWMNVKLPSNGTHNYVQHFYLHQSSSKAWFTSLQVGYFGRWDTVMHWSIINQDLDRCYPRAKQKPEEMNFLWMSSDTPEGRVNRLLEEGELIWLAKASICEMDFSYQVRIILNKHKEQRRRKKIFDRQTFLFCSFF